MKPSREELRDTLKADADRAYCDYIDQMRRTECLGWEAKVRAGQFGKAEMDAHAKANEFLGRHRALMNVVEALAPSESTAESGDLEWELGEMIIEWREMGSYDRSMQYCAKELQKLLAIRAAERENGGGAK